MAFIGEGSKIRCNDFIEKVPHTGDPQYSNWGSFIDLLSETIDPAHEDLFIKCVQDTYSIIKESISEEVINAYDKYDPTRSDILVFIVFMSLMLGDSRTTILSWWETNRVSDCSIEELEKLMQLVGYRWIIANSSQTTEVNSGLRLERQRQLCSLYSSTIHSKGTIQAVKTLIKFTYYLPEYVSYSSTRVVEDWENIELNGVYISSKAMQQQFDDVDHLYPTPIESSRQNAYREIVLEKLEDIRPAGIYFTYPQSDFTLTDFDGLTYYRHSYSDGNDTNIYPWTSIKDLSIIVNKYMNGSKANVLRVSNESYTGMELYSANYKYLPISRKAHNRFTEYDLNQIPFSELANLDFDTDIYSNAKWGEYSGSYFIYDPNDNDHFKTINNWDVSAIMAGRLHSCGLEVVRP